jgi:hypothetical protein
VSSDYRVSPQLAARLLGAFLVASAVVVFLVTGVVVLLQAPVWLLTVAVVLVLAGVVTAGVAMGRSGYVVRLTAEGYRIRYVRGVGVAQARWTDVHDVVEEVVAGSPCIVLRLRDGRHSVIPLELLAVSREEFLRDLRDHLDRGHGLRRLR